MGESLVIGMREGSKNEFMNSSFSDYLLNQIRFHKNAVSQVDGISLASKNFAELCKEARALSASLLQLGIRKGETIAIACENRLEYSVVMVSCIFTGAVFAPINPTYSQDEIVHVLNISKPRIIFCSDYTFKNICLSVPRIKGVTNIVSFGKITGDDLLTTIKYSSLLEARPLDKLHQSRDDDVAVILTSSGTTGLPKGVMLSYANLKYFHNSSVSSRFLCLKPKDIILGLVPLYHGYGFGLLLTSILVGVKFILLPRFEEKLFLKTIQNFKITNLHLVPPLMMFLGKHPLVPKFDLSSVREVICGAAPLSNEVIEQVRARLPQVDIRQGYGMTELSIVVSITPPWSNKPQSVGKLAVGIEAKVLDVDTGKPLGRGQTGEIVIRGPAVMAGYCNDLEATNSTIDSEGWLHTGDVGYVDNEDYIYIVDRIKELIKYNGYQVAPAELESLLMGIPGVKDAAVVGLPDAVAGELPLAFVVLQPNTILTDSSIINYIKGKVSPQKRLRAVRFVESIPRSPSGKILRRLLRKTLTSKL